VLFVGQGFILYCFLSHFALSAAVVLGVFAVVVIKHAGCSARCTTSSDDDLGLDAVPSQFKSSDSVAQSGVFVGRTAVACGIQLATPNQRAQKKWRAFKAG